MEGRTSSSSSFVPSGERSFEIGHLPNEIEDLHRWFARLLSPKRIDGGKKGSRCESGGIKTDGWRGNWDKREKKFSGDMERRRRKRRRERGRQNRTGLS